MTNTLLDAPFSHLEREARSPTEAEAAREIETLMRRLLTLLGEDPERPGIVGTPARMAKSLRWLTRGYRQSAREELGSAIFQEHYESMLLVRDIEIYSLCEHHLLPFFGRVHIAYIPDGQVVGLSKLARLTSVFARRLQVQERLTEQIAEALFTELRPRGVGVAIEAAHLCMMMRGVEKQGSTTTTTAFRGVFAESEATRREFLSLAVPLGGR